MSSQTLRALIEQRDQLDARIAEMKNELRGVKLAEAIAIIQEFEFTAHDLGLIKTQHLKRGPKGPRTFQAKATPTRAPALYRDPASGKTWSGHGRTPHWLSGDKDEYLIREAQ